MVYVIGSGPAGTAAAHALLKQGVAVTMLDVGAELEPEKQTIVEELYSNPPEKWKPELIAKLKTGMAATASGVPKKLVYGSDYPFRDAGQAGVTEMKGVAALISGAKGGLSNIWGSNLMPYTESDISDWCISMSELSPHYDAIAALVPVSACRDDLDESFPVRVKDPVMLRPSRQARALMETLRRNKDALRANGMVAGYSRLAVQVNPSESNPRGCVYCGLCMYGCPYHLIYSSADSVQKFQSNENFRYVPDVIVEKLVERGDHVEIIARSRATAGSLRYQADRVYLAAGVMSTARILLESMEAYGQSLSVKDSQYFLLPILHYRGVPGVMSEALHTLGQLYVNVSDEALSKKTIQLQFYTYNDLYVEAMRGKLGPLWPLARPFMPAFFGRLSIIMGYLHSDDSNDISLRLERTGQGTKLCLESRLSEKTNRIIRGITRKLWRHRGLFRAVPISPMLEIAPPGKSYHYGSTFPMKKAPRRFESDAWGRPHGFRRVHVVDASVLPGIAATSIVFTAMANAHRIASAHEETRPDA